MQIYWGCPMARQECKWGCQAHRTSPYMLPLWGPPRPQMYFTLIPTLGNWPKRLFKIFWGLQILVSRLSLRLRLFLERRGGRGWCSCTVSSWAENNSTVVRLFRSPKLIVTVPAYPLPGCSGDTPISSRNL